MGNVNNRGMGNVNNRGNGRAQDVEKDAAEAENAQVGRYAPLLASMFGGSFPTSVAIYSLIKKSSDIVKLFVFGGVTLGVFAIASGFAATTLGRTPGTICYAKFAALAAVTIVLGLFTGGLVTLFTTLPYQIGCGVVCGSLIIGCLFWLILDW